MIVKGKDITKLMNKLKGVHKVNSQAKATVTKHKGMKYFYDKYKKYDNNLPK